jgi:hypothetical protein
MRKFVTIFLSVLFGNCYAQMIPNGSFEQADSAGNLYAWKTTQGNVNRLTARVINGIPFTATDSSFFLSMENDTSVSPVKTARITNVFPDSVRFPTLSFSYFYAPNLTTQRFGVEVLFSRWKNGIRDTILFLSDSLQPVFDSATFLHIGWNDKSIDLNPGYRDTATAPDTASITVRNDIVPPLANTTLLLLDNFRFSSWRVGIKEITFHYSIPVYPNPATGLLNIVLPDAGEIGYHFADLSGKELVQGTEHGGRILQLDLSGFTNGIYLLHLVMPDGAKSSVKVVILK